MALGSTQPLTEMSTRCISWGKGGRCVRLRTLPPSCVIIMKSGTLTSWNPLDYSRPVMGLLCNIIWHVSVSEDLNFEICLDEIHVSG